MIDRGHMPEARTCPKCGASLPRRGWAGLCPKCVVRVSLGVRQEGATPSAELEPEQDAASPPTSWWFDHRAERPRRFGDYELLEEVGRGGMGVVFKARQLSLNRRVAVKMIASGALAGPEFVHRFQLEAQAAAGLQHPNIIGIHEVGVRDGQHFYSMDYVEGQTLDERAKDNPLPANLAADYLKTIAEAVHYAHQRGILHRDLKPSNVLIDSLDRPHLTDFGLAKRLTGESDLTLTGQVLGSPNYMAPELALGERHAATVACDVYSLGAILYFLLAGRPPFAARSVAETLQEVLQREPVRPRLMNPGVPRDLETVCLKCLSKEPPRRYGSAQELAEDLDRFLQGEPVQARPVRAVSRGWRWCRRNRVVASFAAATLVLLLAVAIGSPIAAFRINLNRHRAEQEALHAKEAERKATEQLRQSYLEQARANRWSGRAGRRFDSLEALTKAAAIRPSPELRNEAIACLALTDVRVASDWGLDLPRPPVVDHYLAPRLDRYAAVNYQDSTLSVRRMADHAELVRISLALSGERWDARFSPDSRYFALAAAPAGASNPQLTVFDSNTGNVVFRREGDSGVAGLDFSPNSQLIAVLFIQGEAAVPPPVQVFDLASGTTNTSLDQRVAASAARFDPAGSRLAISSRASTNLQIWSLQIGQLVRSLPHPAALSALAWHPDGVLLAAACDDKRVYVWDATTGRLRNVLQGPQSEVTRLEFNHAGDLLAASGWDNTIRLWDPLGEVPPLSMPGTLCLFSPDDRRLVCARSPRMVLADVAAGHECRALHSDLEPYKGPRGCQFSPDGQWLASAHSDGVRLWDPASGNEIAFLRLGNTWSVVFDADDSSFFSSGAAGLKQWPFGVHANSQTRELRIGPPRDLWRSSACARASPDREGRVLAFLDGARLRVLDAASGRELGPPGAAAVDYVAVSPDARWCVAGPRGQLWHLRTGQLARELPLGYNAALRWGDNAAPTFSPDGNWLAGGGMDEFRFLAVGSWERIRTLPREAPGIQVPVAFTADSRMAAVAAAPTKVRLLALPSFRELATLESPDPQMLSFLCFSPDGSRLAAAAETKQIQLWDLRSIRRQLAAMNLDWDAPPLPPPANEFRGKIEATILTATNSINPAEAQKP